MFVTMKTLARGPDFSADPGELKEVTDEHGAQLIAAGHADLAPELCDPPAGVAPAARRERATGSKRTTR